MRPTASEYAPAHTPYVVLVPEDDVLSAIERQFSETQRLLASLDETRAAFRYEKSKWSVKEVIGHVCDGERILGYRALAIARGDMQPLPGFDENLYTANGGFGDWKVADLSEMYALVRRATIVFFRNLSSESWARRGIANSAEVSVLGLAYVIVGHERHHLKVLRERYYV